MKKENKTDWSLMGPSDYKVRLEMDKEGNLAPKKAAKKTKGVKTWKPKIVQKEGIIR